MPVTNQLLILPGWVTGNGHTMSSGTIVEILFARRPSPGPFLTLGKRASSNRVARGDDQKDPAMA
jgi:hypothetical protein